MGWERLLTDAVYHNNLEEVQKYVAKDDVRRAIGRREWAEATAPLHKAASIGRNDALRLLVEAGGDVNSYSLHDNEDRMTCLHFAVWCNHVDTVKLCLSLGAELGLEGTWLDYTGTPLDFAQQFKHKEVLDVFRDFLGGEIKGERRPDTATVNRINTTTILTGLENLPIREKALWKAEELLKKHEKVERAVTDLRKKLELAEREMFEVEGNPYFMKFEDVNALRQEIQDLAVFATEVTKILSDRQHGQRDSSFRETLMRNSVDSPSSAVGSPSYYERVQDNHREHQPPPPPPPQQQLGRRGRRDRSGGRRSDDGRR